MEVLDFLKIKPNQYGSGYGDGDGCGDGNECGGGDGRGYGAGYEYGRGSGSGHGTGYGDEAGNGYGFGYEHEYRNGDEEGVRFGLLSGKGYKIKILNANEVHYVDDIPCIFRSIKGNIAKVTIINQHKYQDEGIVYIAKNDYFFAHGRTIREAVEALNAKYYVSLDIETKISEFKKLFQKGAVDVKTLHTWHGILTGSCQYGRSQFQKEHGLKNANKLTLNEFIALTQNVYGSHVIEKLKEK